MAEDYGALIEDFTEYVETAVFTFLIATEALHAEAERLRVMQFSEEDPNPWLPFGPGNPAETPPTVLRRWSEVIHEIDSGSMRTRLGHHWISHVYSGWDVEFRKRFASAHGWEVGDAVSPLMGDLRLLRNDVIHHRGVASRPNVGNCTVLNHWFKPGEDIALNAAHVNEFVVRLRDESLIHERRPSRDKQ
jgi:hypothetical protein